MKLAKRFSIILFVVGILLAMSISASAWEVVGYGANHDDATDVEIISAGGIWSPMGTTGNPQCNVIIPAGAMSVEIKVNGIVREGTWEEVDTNHYIIQFGLQADCFAGENEVTVTATYPDGAKSATGKFHAISKTQESISKSTHLNFTTTYDGITLRDTTTPTFVTEFEGSFPNRVDEGVTEGYMVFTGPQLSEEARLIRPFSVGSTSYKSHEKWVNFRYFTSSADAKLSVNYSAGAKAEQAVELPTGEGQWFTVGIHHTNIKYPNGDGTFHRRGYVYVNGEHVGTILPPTVGTEHGLMIYFNPGENDTDFVAFDYYSCYMLSGNETRMHTVFPMGIDAFDADEGFSVDTFEADETKTFPVGTRAVALRISRGATSLTTDETFDSKMSLYKDGVLVDPDEVTFSFYKDTVNTENSSNWYILAACAEELEPGNYTIASEPNMGFAGGTTIVVSVGGTFTIGNAAPAISEYAVADNGTAISGSNVAIKANISAPAAAAATARVFFAVYNEDGVLVAAKVAAVTAGSTVPYESSVAVDDATGLTVKAFVFDTANLKPLTTTATTVFAQ